MFSLYCYSSKATAVTGLDLIPIERDSNGNIMEVDGDSVCASAAGAPTDLTPVLSSATTVRFVYKDNSKKDANLKVVYV